MRSVLSRGLCEVCGARDDLEDRTVGYTTMSLCRACRDVVDREGTV